MNIFDVLSQGKSRLHEPAISALLGYLLGTHKDHGLGDSFVRAFLELLQKQISSPVISSIINRSFIDTDVSLEEPYQLNGSRKDIDIQISILNNNKEEDCRIIIENKIKTGAANKDQLVDYYTAILEDDDSIPNLIVVFLTPKSDQITVREEFSSLDVNENHDKAWVFWNDEENGVLEIIRTILRKELEGDIPPINEYMRHTLKAFILHVRSIVETSTGGKYRVGVDLGEIVDEIEIQLSDGIDYRVVRRNSQQIQVFDNDDKLIAKPILRKIIDENGLDIPKMGINTRTMGKRIIDALKAD